MVTEIGTHSEFKASLLETPCGWPVPGFSYLVHSNLQPLVVLSADSVWVHVVTLDLHSSTSIDRNQWDFYAAHSQVIKTNVPRLDIAELRQSLLGS
jgi:hypothetical protein